MSYIQEKRVDLGLLIRDSFAVLASVKREVALYLGGLLALALLAEINSQVRGIVAIVSLLVFFLGQYFLYQAILRKAGLLQDDRKRIFGFVGMTLMLGFAIYVGFAFLVIPGLLLGAKWIMAPTYLVARDRNVFEAIGDSWRASEFNTGQLVVGYLVFWVLWTVVFIALAGIGEAILPSGGGSQSALAWLAMHLLPVAMMGLSIATYRQLSDDTNSLTQVFA
ncbi:hypothetical protein [Erythrobacter alti]|uniref:hypothetical protein n=1 Tax=Erythrobacter alti TaxID=1896145 RepID=UPI0030F39E43